MTGCFSENISNDKSLDILTLDTLGVKTLKVKRQGTTNFDFTHCEVLDTLFQSAKMQAIFHIDKRKFLKLIYLVDTTQHLIVCEPKLMKGIKIQILNDFPKEKILNDKKRTKSTKDMLYVLKFEQFSSNEYELIFLRKEGGNIIHLSFSIKDEKINVQEFILANF